MKSDPLQCQRCRFHNVPGAVKCLDCGTVLGVDTGGGTQTQRFRLTDQPTIQPRGVSRVEAPAEGRVMAWLCCETFDPVPVGTKPMLLMGRGTTCDLVLPHSSVSRIHAVVRTLGGKIVVEDRSSYGTWVNGKRVVATNLKFDDTITLGPYEITLRPSQTGKIDPDAEETRPFQDVRSSEDMHGRLEKVSLEEVLQQIEFYKKTGTFKVFDETSSGILVIYEGRPMYAEWGDLADDQAVFHMLALEKGKFSFMSKVEPGEMTMADQTLTGLLLDASRRKDEGGGGA